MITIISFLFLKIFFIYFIFHIFKNKNIIIFTKNASNLKRFILKSYQSFLKLKRERERDITI